MSPAATMTLAHDALLPRAAGGNGPGLVLALLVHAALAAALTVSVDWRAQSSDVVAAELWAAVPQAAAPVPAVVAPVAQPAAPPPTPAPPPPQAAALPTEADIATERAERRKVEAARKKAQAEADAEDEAKRKKRELAEAERKKLELVQADRKKRDQAELKAREAQADDERLARQREENLRRMMGQAGTATAGTGTAAQSAAPSAAYTGRLVALIRGNLVYTGSTPDNNAAEVEVSAAAGGAIISRRLVKSSGHKDWDEAVLRAIDRTATLPRDTDGRVPPRLLIAFRPKD